MSGSDVYETATCLREVLDILKSVLALYVGLVWTKLAAHTEAKN